MPGLDIRGALTTLNIDSATLVHIMTGFLADNRQTVDLLKKALADDDMDILRQTAHSLKGSSANIGAGELSAAARVLEDACAQTAAGDGGASGIGPLIDRVAVALERVLQSIASLETRLSGARPPVDPVTTESAESLLAALTDAIDRADPEAIEILLPAFKQQAMQSEPVLASALAELEAQLQRYDYDQALETIQRFNRK